MTSVRWQQLRFFVMDRGVFAPVSGQRLVDGLRGWRRAVRGPWFVHGPPGHLRVRPDEVDWSDFPDEARPRS